MTRGFGPTLSPGDEFMKTSSVDFQGIWFDAMCALGLGGVIMVVTGVASYWRLQLNIAINA